MSIYDKASLVLIPSGTKTSKVYSQKPVNGDGDFTFSRSTAATRVNADGNIEKETQNLLLQSNTFDTSWSAGGTVTGGQADKDGGTSAWSFTSSTATSGLNQNITTGGVQTFSAYVKKNATNGVRVYMFGSLNAATFFDLNNGSVVSSTGGTLDASIEAYNSEWWRVSVTCNSTLSSIYFYCTNNSQTQVVGTITIQDAQLEQGLVARDYIETTTAAVEGGITDNVPRLDYTDSSCPALLLEPQRTNLVDYSEYYDLFDSNVTLTTNADTSPEGVDNASKIVVSSESQPRIERYNTWSNSTTYSMSAYVKADTGRYIGFGLYSPEMGNQWVRFDLTNETFGYSDTNWSNAAIVDAGDDWYRISATITTDATNTSRSGFKLASMKSNSYNTGTIGDSFFVYGIQVEQGSYATSYIPTYGSAVTRNQDVCSVSNIGDLINDSEGTFYAEIQAQANDSDAKVLTIGDGTSLNRVQIFYHLGTNIRTNIISNGSSQVTDFTSSIDQTDNIKVAIRYANNNAKMFLNGVEVHSDTSVTTPTGLDVLRFNNGTGGSLFFGYLRGLIYIPTALTDQEAIDLTTL